MRIFYHFEKFKQYLRLIRTFKLYYVLVLYKYFDYVANPWTRDGQVRAQVVQIAARVSGPIIKLPIADNQFVKTGDLLFEIKPSVFIAELKQAQAELEKTKDDIKSLEKQVGASQANVKMFTANIQQAKMALKKAGCCSTCT